MGYNSAITPIVFVEIGRSPSKYLKNNLSIIRGLFPNRKIIVIVSSKFSNQKLGDNVDLIVEETIAKNSNWIRFESIHKRWSGLQQNYWTNTTKRFFVLGKYMEQNQLERIIHLESDSVLLSEKNLDIEYNDTNWGIKYPKQNNFHGCASILLVNKFEIFNKFLEFIVDNWSRSEITDMELLSEYASTEEQALYLPSGDLVQRASTYIFDGVSIGRFFLGSDARNQRFPFSSRGQRDMTQGSLALVKPEIKLNAQGVLVYKDIDSSELELVNIHMHSKRIPKTYKALEKMILSDSRGRVNPLWRLGVFDKLIFAERLVSFLNRRILRKKHFEFRLR